MGSRLSNILLLVLAFMFQLAICDYINLGPFVYICLIPLLIIYIPRQVSPNVVMLAAFALGILLDVLSDGILGLNASAAVMTAALRKPLYKLIINEDRQDRTVIPTIRIVGVPAFLKYLSALTAIYLLVYISVDCIGTRHIMFVLGKYAVSLAVNIVLSFIISLSLFNRN